jgi:hypothetical protein
MMGIGGTPEVGLAAGQHCEGVYWQKSQQAAPLHPGRLQRSTLKVESTAQR